MSLKAEVNIIKSGAICFFTDKFECSGKYGLFSIVEYFIHSTNDIEIIIRESIHDNDNDCTPLYIREIVRSFSIPSEANKAYIEGIKAMCLK